jgi:hypothetical protein
VGSPADEIDRQRWIGLTFGQSALAVCLLHAVLGLILYEPTLFPGGDNANYMILGESLRSGAGYRDLYLPTEPLHAKYPPLFPALLAVLGWLGGLQLYKLAMLACTITAVWLTIQIGRRLLGDGPGLLVGFLLAVNPVLLEYAHYVLSEAPFVALILLALWAAGQSGKRGYGLAVVAAIAAFLTRTAGLTVLLAIPLAAALSQRFRRATLAGGIGLAVMLLWGLYQRWAAPDQAGYLQELALRNPYDPAAGSVGLAGLFARAAGNAWTYVSRVLPQTLTGLDPIAVPILITLIGVVLATLVLVGWVRRVQEHVGAAELFVLLYAGLICVWPEVWTDRRFLLPLAPFLLLFAVSGARQVGESWRPRLGAWVSRASTPALALLIVLPALAFVARQAPLRTGCVARYRAGDPCDPPALASLFAAARWAQANTEPDAIIANRKPSLFYWHSRRRGDLYRYSTETEVVIRGLEEMGADYVVVDQVSGTTLRYLVPAIQTHRLRFEGVYEGGQPPTFVLRFLAPPTTALRPVARDDPAAAQAAGPAAP